MSVEHSLIFGAVWCAIGFFAGCWLKPIPSAWPLAIVMGPLTLFIAVVDWLMDRHDG